jgi:2-keto-4-pentenoate hydratase
MTHAERLGWKAGFGTTAAMEMLGTTGPLAAPLTTATLVADGGSQSIEGWARPILEAELAVRIGPDGEVEAVAAAIELVDLHGPLDDIETILANGIYHRAVVLGEFTSARPPELIIDVVRNGVADTTGADACALTGLPEDVLRHMGSHGADLQPGDVVITGAAVPPLEVTPDDVVLVRFPDIGEVSIRLT